MGVKGFTLVLNLAQGKRFTQEGSIFISLLSSTTRINSTNDLTAKSAKVVLTKALSQLKSIDPDTTIGQRTIL